MVSGIELDRLGLLAHAVATTSLWLTTNATATVPSGATVPYLTAPPAPEIAAVGVHWQPIGVVPPGVPPALPTASARVPVTSPGVADSRETGKPSVLSMIVAGLAVVVFIVERRRRAP